MEPSEGELERCKGLSEDECSENDKCEDMYGPSYCKGETCTTDWVFQECVSVLQVEPQTYE